MIRILGIYEVPTLWLRSVRIIREEFWFPGFQFGKNIHVLSRLYSNVDMSIQLSKLGLKYHSTFIFEKWNRDANLFEIREFKILDFNWFFRNNNFLGFRIFRYSLIEFLFYWIIPKGSIMRPPMDKDFFSQKGNFRQYQKNKPDSK